MGAALNNKIAALIVLGVMSCLFLSSCATSLETVKSRYSEAPVSCRSYGEFDYEKLALNDSRVFRLDEKSKAYNFDTGKSYFKAFELPKYRTPYVILVRSYLIGGTRDSFYIFSPAVMFLDEHFNVVGSCDNKVFQYQKISLFDFESAGNAWAIEGRIPIEEKDADKRCMVVFTTDELQAGKSVHMFPHSLPIFVPSSKGGIFLPIPTGSADTILIPHSPAGKLKVEIQSLDE